MNKEIYSNLIKRVSKSDNKRIAKAVEWIVDNECSAIGDGPLTGDYRQNVLESITLDMTNGAGLMKSQYILTGIVIGCIGTTIISLTINKINKKEKA